MAMYYDSYNKTITLIQYCFITLLDIEIVSFNLIKEDRVNLREMFMDGYRFLLEVRLV